MIITFALSTGSIVLMLVSVVLFGLATLLCHSQGLFDGNDSLGICGMFMVVIYSFIWAVPSLLAWAVWATWLK